MTQYSTQILRTLSDQVQNLTPLRQSFKHLQSYYSKLINQYNDLIAYGQHSENELSAKLRYLHQIHRQLEYQFGKCGDELRQAECEHAKLLMEKNQQIAQGEALKSRYQLQQNQKCLIEEKRNNLLEHKSKLQFNIAKYKELIHNLELVVKSKEYENIDIQRQIKKLELVNSKITQLNKETEQNINSTQTENEDIIQQLHDLQVKLDSYSRLVQAKQKMNKQHVQTLITKTEQLQQLRHSKQYLEKLVDTETQSQKELLRNYGQIESILTLKRQKLQLIQQQNYEYQTAIQSEQSLEHKNKIQLQKLTNYLQTLVQTNTILFGELERSCAEDRQVQIMLSEKLEKLMLVNDKITQNQMFSKFDLNSVQKVKITSPPAAQSLKRDLSKAKLTSPTASNKKNLDYQFQQRISRIRDQHMSSTWGSFSKQNRHIDH